MTANSLRHIPRFWMLSGLLAIVALIACALAPSATSGAGPAGAKKNADGTYGENHFNPVKENGEIFEGWKPPQALIVITGSQDGYIEPCGCAGLENQKGGMSRRYDLIKMLQDKKWPLVALDAGGLVKGFGKQAIEKYGAAVDCLLAMNYGVIGLGVNELKLSVDEIISKTADDARFVSANVGLVDFDDAILKRYRVFSLNGVKIGVTSIINKTDFDALANNKELKLLDPVKGLNEVYPAMLKEGCRRMILLTSGDVKEAEALAKTFPGFTDVVVAGGGDIPPARPTVIEGTKTLLLETGHKGMYAIALGLYDDAARSVLYQRIPLDARFGDSEPIAKIFAAYQEKLEKHGLSGLGVKASPNPSGRGAYVGSKACGVCHTKAYDVWKDTTHATAFDTLVDATPQRNHDPECLSCHVTGWDPQRYYPYTTGFLSLKETPHLVGNGCENCHGPGKKHADAETLAGKVDSKVIAALREQMKAPRDQSSCVQCHDVDNSPEFNFEKYWSQIEHKGKD